jgi:RND family efflux transporter MFP subunit
VKTAKRGLTLLLVIALVSVAAGLAVGVWLARTADQKSVDTSNIDTNEQLYTCGMHPQVIQKGPGLCPICGMKLTPIKGSGGANKTPTENSNEAPISGLLKIDPLVVQNMGIRTATLKRASLTKTIRTVGRVDYDEQGVTFINTKFKGWIEKLHVAQTGQHVKKGQPLFEIYSPELYSAQQEYLTAFRGIKALGSSSDLVADQNSRLETVRTRLRFLDVTDEQIANLEQTGQVPKTLSIYSPAEGIVTEKMVQEGKYIETGMKLYTIADLSRVWVYVSIYEYQIPWIRMGQSASMTLPYIPGKEFLGKVVYIYPYLEEQTRVIRVRLEFANPALELKPDMYANVMLKSELDRAAVLIPREAYIDSGVRKVAFVSLGDGKFQAHEIQTGVEAEEGMVEVLQGLTEGDTVVTSGQFLLDAESKLGEAIAKMSNSQFPMTSSQPTAHMDHDSLPTTQNSSSTQPETGPFICPMHPKQVAEKPGTCPICAMQLVSAEHFHMPTSAPARVQQELDHLTEHYLALQKLLASDTTKDVARHALGIAAASEEMLKHVSELEKQTGEKVAPAVRKIHDAALKISGSRIADDRVQFVDLSNGMLLLLEYMRADPQRWPKLFIFHCAMSKGSWLQNSETITNPYYGFQMLRCGELKGTK